MGDKWAIVTENRALCVVIADFNKTLSHHLEGVKFGEIIEIVEECQDWYRGTLQNSQSRTLGTFPKSFVRLKNSRKVKRHGKYEIELDQDPFAKEISGVVREWGIILVKLFKERDVKKFKHIKELMNKLIRDRRQIIADYLSEDHLCQLKAQTTEMIDVGNRELGLDMIPRNVVGEVIDAKTTSIPELYKVHEQQALLGKQQVQYTRQDSSVNLEQRMTEDNHLFLEHKTFACHLGEDTVVSYQIYDANEEDFVSEAFVVHLTGKGQPMDSSLIGMIDCVFTEIQVATQSKLYLVAIVNRLGEMEAGRTSGLQATKQPAKLRRPVACGVVLLQDFLTTTDDENDHEFVIKLNKCEEDVFPDVWRYIIADDAERFQPFDKGKGVVISCRLLSGDIDHVTKTHQMLFKRTTALARRRGFPDVIKPEEERNDLYVTIAQGRFEKGEKKSERNIEVMMQVVDDKNVAMENVIVPGAGIPRPKQYTTIIYYHNNSPKWFENVKLDVPLDKIEKAYMKFTFKHCSSTDKHEKKDVVFAVAHKALMETYDVGRALLRDDLHNLPVYKSNPKNDKGFLNPKSLTPNAKESFHIRTLACSTRFTQEPMLLNLLRWESKISILGEILTKVSDVTGTEMVKFLKAIFDALFKILEVHKEKFSQKVFEALVHVCSELTQAKFSHYRPQLDAYLKHHLRSTTAYEYIIDYVNKSIVEKAKEENPDVVKFMKKMMKSLELIFNFAFQSRMLNNRKFKLTNRTDNVFRDKVTVVLRSFSQFMGDAEPRLISMQQLCLRHISSVFSLMSPFFTDSETSDFATSYLNSIPTATEQLSKTFTTAKMKYLHSLVHSSLFSSPIGRRHVLPTMLTGLQGNIMNRVHISQGLTLLGDILTGLVKETPEQRHGDVLHIAKSLLKPMMELCDIEVAASKKKMTRGVDVVSMSRRHAMSKRGDTQGSEGKFFPCLLALLRHMTRDHYMAIFSDMESEEREKTMEQVLDTFITLLTEDIFPKDWMVMVMVNNDVLLASVESISCVLDKYYLKDFKVSLWGKYFQLLSQYITHKSLKLHEFSNTKQQKILQGTPDRRVAMAEIMARQFKKIESSDQFKFLIEDNTTTTKSFLQSLQLTALVPEQAVQTLLIPLFYELIECEVKTSNNFDIVEREMINQLDRCMSEGFGNRQYQTKFHDIMGQLCQSSENPVVREQGKELTIAVNNLLKQLLALREVPEGSAYHDRRTGCMYHLMMYYKGNNQRRLTLKYVHRLVDLHKEMGHFAEAGFTLILHADMLEWTNKKLKPMKDEGNDRFPAQTERQRKEQVYMKILDYFDTGEQWEHAISYAKELAKDYEDNSFQYDKLSGLYTKISTFYQRIAKGGRTLPQYFKVGYYGLEFPYGYRNETYVYRSKNKNDHIRVFTDKIQNQFPQANILMKDTDPTPEMKNSPNMSIMISKLTPVADEDKIQAKFKGNPVSDEISAFYSMNEISTCKYSRPYRKGDKTGNEFETLWTANTNLLIETAMPFMLAKARIIKNTVEHISPIDNACVAMRGKNDELQVIIAEKANNAGMSINPLTMVLNGVLDAAVMGGTQLYREAFFNDKYKAASPENELKAIELESLMNQQVEILEVGVKMHGANIPENLKPLQKRHEELLDGLVKGKEESLKTLKMRRQASFARVSTPDSKAEPKQPRLSISKGKPVNNELNPFNKGAPPGGSGGDRGRSGSPVKPVPSDVDDVTKAPNPSNPFPLKDTIKPVGSESLTVDPSTSLSTSSTGVPPPLITRTKPTVRGNPTQSIKTKKPPPPPSSSSKGKVPERPASAKPPPKPPKLNKVNPFDKMLAEGTPSTRVVKKPTVKKRNPFDDPTPTKADPPPPPKSKNPFAQ